MEQDHEWTGEVSKLGASDPPAGQGANEGHKLTKCSLGAISCQALPSLPLSVWYLVLMQLPRCQIGGYGRRKETETT